MTQSRAVAVINRDAIIERVRNGEILRDIAKDYGVTKQSLHVILKNDPEYQAALPEQADAMVWEAKDAVWNAREQSDIARARGMTDWAFRYAAAVDPRYSRSGQQLAPLNIQINIERAHGADAHRTTGLMSNQVDSPTPPIEIDGDSSSE